MQRIALGNWQLQDNDELSMQKKSKYTCSQGYTLDTEIQKTNAEFLSFKA